MTRPQGRQPSVCGRPRSSMTPHPIRHSPSSRRPTTRPLPLVIVAMIRKLDQILRVWPGASSSPLFGGSMTFQNTLNAPYWLGLQGARSSAIEQISLADPAKPVQLRLPPGHDGIHGLPGEDVLIGRPIGE